MFLEIHFLGSCKNLSGSGATLHLGVTGGFAQSNDQDLAGSGFNGSFQVPFAGLYAVYIFLVTLAFPKATPGLPAEAVGFREADNSRGLISLAILAVVSGVFGWLMMRHSETHGADFVVLSMFFAVADVSMSQRRSSWSLSRCTRATSA